MMTKHHNHKILLVEDNQHTRKLLREGLGALGYDLIETGNTRDSLKLALTEDPDLILIDLNLPDENGLEIIKKIRQINMLKNIPILATSADGNRGIELFMNIHELGQGVIEYLTKPISLSELTERINVILLPEQKKAA